MFSLKPVEGVVDTSNTISSHRKWADGSMNIKGWVKDTCKIGSLRSTLLYFQFFSGYERNLHLACIQKLHATCVSTRFTNNIDINKCDWGGHHIYNKIVLKAMILLMIPIILFILILHRCYGWVSIIDNKISVDFSQSAVDGWRSLFQIIISGIECLIIQRPRLNINASKWTS